MLYIRYNMKSSKMFVLSRWDRLPLEFDEINSMNEMQ